MILVTVALLLHLAWVPEASDVTTEPAIVSTLSATTPSAAEADNRSDGTALGSSGGQTSARFTAVSLDPTSQNSQVLSTIRVPSIEPGTPRKPISVED